MRLTGRGLRVGGIWLGVFGFGVMVVGAVWSWGSDPETGLRIVALGLGSVSAALGLISLVLAKESRERMQAMANLDVSEKIAMMHAHMGEAQERSDWDQKAALELKVWVEPQLWEQFEDAQQKYRDFVEQKKSKTNKPIVVKIGGSTLGSHDTTIEDLVALQEEGRALVVVHGGGSVITEWLAKQGVPTKFEKGLRVTDQQTLQVVVAVLAGLVNKELVAAIQSRGGRAVGLSGIDGGLIEAKIKDEKLGYVGDIVKINPKLVNALLKEGYIPVIAPLGLDTKGQKLNINADTAAAEIAAAVKAERLVFLTDVAGVMDKSGKLLPRLSHAEVDSLIAQGVIYGGMIPKVEACFRALSKVPLAQIVDGRERHALVEALSGKGSGTTITSQ